MIVELFLANAAVLIIHIYITYKNLLNPKPPVISILLALASFFLYSSIMIEININTPLNPNSIVAYVSTISLTSFILLLNLILLIVNMYFFVKLFINITKKKIFKQKTIRAY